jgi:hypothetical protein
MQIVEGNHVEEADEFSVYDIESNKRLMTDAKRMIEYMNEAMGGKDAD